MNTSDIWVALLGGGVAGVILQFVQFLITRKDNNTKDKYVNMSELTELTSKIDKDFKRLNKHDKDIQELKESNKIILSALFALLEHAKTNNNTGGMSQCQKEIFEYLNK